MSHLRVPGKNLSRGLLALDFETANYVVRVHRLQVGDQIQLFDPKEHLQANALITKVHWPQVEVKIEGVEKVQIHHHAITLVQALLKFDKMDGLIRDATELGVTKIIPVMTERSFMIPSMSRQQRWQKILVESVRQCGRSDLPEMMEPIMLEEMFKEVSGDESCFVLCPHTKVFFKEGTHLNQDGPIVLASGPEGGFSEKEMVEFEQNGFQPIRLGQWVLRAETAPVAALGAWISLKTR